MLRQEGVDPCGVKTVPAQLVFAGQQYRDFLAIAALQSRVAVDVDNLQVKGPECSQRLQSQPHVVA